MSAAEVSVLADGRVRLHSYERVEDWVKGAAESIAAALGQFGRSLLLSGGNTPTPIYSALSQLSLDWTQVNIGLVDERCLPETDPNRNDHLIQRTLLTNAAASASFVPLFPSGHTPEQAAHAANQRAQSPAVVVLGMGDDGHTASLFPGMSGLDTALTCPDVYVAVDAAGCPGAQTWPRRISLTPAGLARATARILLIRGHSKRVLLDKVLAGQDFHEYPVRTAWTTPGPRLDIYWCP